MWDPPSQPHRFPPGTRSRGALRNLAFPEPPTLCFKFPACPGSPLLPLQRAPPPAVRHGSPSPATSPPLSPKLPHNPCPKPSPAVSHLISFLGGIIIYKGRRWKISRATTLGKTSSSPLSTCQKSLPPKHRPVLVMRPLKPPQLPPLQEEPTLLCAEPPDLLHLGSGLVATKF